MGNPGLDRAMDAEEDLFNPQSVTSGDKGLNPIPFSLVYRALISNLIIPGNVIFGTWAGREQYDADRVERCNQEAVESSRPIRAGFSPARPSGYVRRFQYDTRHGSHDRAGCKERERPLRPSRNKAHFGRRESRYHEGNGRKPGADSSCTCGF